MLRGNRRLTGPKPGVERSRWCKLIAKYNNETTRKSIRGLAYINSSWSAGADLLKGIVCRRVAPCEVTGAVSMDSFETCGQIRGVV